MSIIFVLLGFLMLFIFTQLTLNAPRVEEKIMRA